MYKYRTYFVVWRLVFVGSVYASSCGEWTDWMDDEFGGIVDLTTGEFELVDDLRANFSICSSPSSLECQTAIPPFLSYDQTGQTVTCQLPHGLICFHTDNVSPCRNYAVRVFCPRECTTQNPITMGSDLSTEDYNDSITNISTPRTVSNSSELHSMRSSQDVGVVLTVLGATIGSLVLLGGTIAGAIYISKKYQKSS
ncbi:uncharacterized protein LOC100369852 [Saccoglossus kowalevskii]|uniref:Mucin-2-like n=1 Tax=Saccoglossus kowalevskii TaxID=10224 RepID=A0ABM0LUX7_SACKO|nr:PREDICTED: mucin-2-like [Saccoglossus kowalevskii]